MKTIFELNKEANILDIYTADNGLIQQQDVIELAGEVDVYDIENIIEDYMLEFGLEEKDIIRKNIGGKINGLYEKE